MPDFLLELRSEEIPARMQAKASSDLVRLFSEKLAEAGLYTTGTEAYATPRRLALIARGLPEATTATSEEVKGPRAAAPPQALEGFLRKTGLTRDQLQERDGIFFAVTEKPGRPTADVLAEAVPTIVRAFPWPKSMRWGAASATTDSLRWVRPLQGIVALLGEDIVPFEIAGIASGAATVGHRFHHPGPITIGSAGDYVEKLRACHVILDPAERAALIADRARALAAQAGLTLVEDEGLLAENAGLTEWPVPLLGRFDPAFLDVPPEVIQLTMRTNQKYFALQFPGEGRGPAVPGPGPRPSPGNSGSSLLAPNFICTANIDASDGGLRVVAGNQKVLAARLSDAKFFWEQDLKTPLEDQAAKLSQIVFHEKLGTLADKVDRVAKLARWLVEESIVTSCHPRESGDLVQPATDATSELDPRFRGDDKDLAALAERAARLCKADLVTAMVGEFPELQGIIGGHLARAQGEHPAVAAAIRDHYKPVGQGDEVPTDPVTVAVSLADKLDSLVMFFGAWVRATGSKNPFALRRTALGVIWLLQKHQLRLSVTEVSEVIYRLHAERTMKYRDALERDDIVEGAEIVAATPIWFEEIEGIVEGKRGDLFLYHKVDFADERWREYDLGFEEPPKLPGEKRVPIDIPTTDAGNIFVTFSPFNHLRGDLLDFFADRLKVQQREAGVRHDLIDAVFALGGEDDLVRLLARVRALQAFVETPEGADLLAGYKRAANILKKEGFQPSPLQGRGARGEAERGEWESGSSPLPPLRGTLSPEGEREKRLSYTPLPEEAALIAALDSAEPRARAAVEAEDFEGAMAALASLRGPVDAFFDKVTVNDPDPAKRAARLALLARMRDAVHQVADFSRIEG